MTQSHSKNIHLSIEYFILHRICHLHLLILLSLLSQKQIFLNDSGRGYRQISRLQINMVKKYIPMNRVKKYINSMIVEWFTILNTHTSSVSLQRVKIQTN